jgi:hypothetical protein
MLTEGYPWNQNEGGVLGSTGCGHHSRHVVPRLILADSDIDQSFPSAHRSEFLVADTHVAFAISEESFDLVIDPLLEHRVCRWVHVHISVGQNIAQFLTLDLEAVVGKEITKCGVALWVIAPRGGIETEDRSGAGLDDSSPSLGWRMLRLIDDQDGLLGKID